MIRAVLDSNVYVSALLFGGLPRAVVELAHERVFETFVSHEIIAEIESVLLLKFGWSESKITAAALSWRDAIKVRPTSRINACIDPDDDRVLECAVDSEADVIVTGDRHLLGMTRFQNIAILNPRQFLDAAPWLPV
jgi:putative PIN family toxin of toxin-antitoxin system